MYRYTLSINLTNTFNGEHELCKKCHQKEHHAVTYLLCDCDGNVLHTLISKESVLKFLNSLGYFPKDTSGTRRAIRNKTKIYGFYWQRVLKA